MVQRNQELRDYMKANNVFTWQLAEKLNVAETTLYRWLRHPMDEKKTAELMGVVDTISKENGADQKS